MFAMSFGSVGTAYYNIKRRDVWVPFTLKGGVSEVKDKMSQTDAVNILYSMVWSDKEFSEVPDINNRDAFDLLNNRRTVHKEIKEQARIVSLDLVRNNIFNRMLAFMTDGEKKALWDKLQDFLRNTPLGDDHFQLCTYEKAEYSDNNLCWFVSSALIWCFLASNTEKEESSSEGIGSTPNQPSDVTHYDPFNLSEHRSNSSAIRFKLINKDTNAFEEFYTHERVVEYVLKRNLLITKVDFAHGTIRVFYTCLAKRNLRLARVEKRDFQQASDFILDNLGKFKPKLSWRERRISDMALKGLKCKKWTAYAIYDDHDKIISYLDYKLRADFEVELGIQLTEQEYQGQGMATGLINLFCLMFVSNRLFTGTFE